MTEVQGQEFVSYCCHLVNCIGICPIDGSIVIQYDLHLGNSKGIVFHTVNIAGEEALYLKL